MARLGGLLLLSTVPLLVGLASARSEEGILPHGSAPPALASQHFPDRLHEFVWRNWNAVDPAKLAKILGASEDEVTDLAVSMGLAEQPNIPPEMMKRGYVTLIRRNWHLLPYEQLLELLDMTPERLAVMLREEDFLWVKLGRLKPACEPLRYAAPSQESRLRAAEIRRVVEEAFGESLHEPGEPRFDFVKQLAAPVAAAAPASTNRADAMQRIVHSYVAIFGDPLLHPELNPYPDGLLQRLAAVGINGVWIHAVLRDLAPGGDAFPEFGEGSEQRLANLSALVSRAQKFGVRVYLYVNEPRAMPHPFFEKRPEMAGVQEPPLTALCTSHPAVRQWMEDALAHVFKSVPSLGGIYTITASENLTNCASHGDWKSCPMCKDRGDADILAEVVSVLERGVHRGDPNAEVLISDWGWRGHGDASEIIPKLPKQIALMSVSEWSLPIERGGVESVVGEYSISSIGPGPRALPHWRQAREFGLNTGAEIQFNNTCEIATIPYLPVMDLVAEHCGRLVSAANLDAMFIGWTMGGHPSPNLHLAQQVRSSSPEAIAAILDKAALERFGPGGAPHARNAWTLFSEGFREYPFHISVVYTCPVQWGPGNPLYATDTGYSATMWGIPYDDLDGWRGPYPPDVFAAQFEKIVEAWKPAIADLNRAAELMPPGQRSQVEPDLIYAQAASMHFESVANQTRFVVSRDALASASEEAAVRLRDEIQKILASEIDLARRLYDLAQKDSRIGFEPSCQYFYLPLDLVEKVINCRWLMEYFAMKE